MKLSKGVQWGLAAWVAGAAVTGDAPGTEPKRAFVDQVRVCDSTGGAFFVVPGTLTCLRRGNSRRPGDGLLPHTKANGPAEAAVGGPEFWAAFDILGAHVPMRDELLSYTATFGGGISVAMSIERSADARSDRERPATEFPAAELTADEPPADEPPALAVVALSTIAGRPDAEPISINGISAPSFRGSLGATMPEIVGGGPRDEPLGAVQLDAAAAQQVHAGLFGTRASETGSPAYPIPMLPGNPYGLVGGGGTLPDMDYLSPGDRLWLQAAYDGSGLGVINGTAPGAAAAETETGRLGRGGVVAPLGNVPGWRPRLDAGCVWTGSFVCEPRIGRDDGSDAAAKPRPPTFSSVLSGPAQDVQYDSRAIAGFGGTVTMPDSKDTRASPSFIGMPVSGFDIGAEFMYVNVKQPRAPAAGGSDPRASPAAGGRGGKTNPTEYQGRLRVQQGF